VPAIRCFLIEPTSVFARQLRRFCAPSLTCPRNASGYHMAQVPVGTVRSDRAPPSGDLWPHDDPRWPTLCACGYIFDPVDYWSVSHQQLYLRPETGNVYTLIDAPEGAMWYADWSPHRGPDGHSLVLKTPAGEWQIDAPGKDGGRWTRSGTPPLVTVTPPLKLKTYTATLHGGLLIPWEDE
jgi:hypothetical protein